MEVKAGVGKVGKPEDYIGLTVTNELINTIAPGEMVKVVGVVIGAIELESLYELTIKIHDNDVIKMLTLQKPQSFEIG